MGMLTSIGLVLDIFGAIILLGPEYGPIERTIKRVDPLYQAVQYGMNALYREGTEIEDGTKKTGGEMEAGRWEFTVARWFLNRRIEGRIRRDDLINLAGVGIRKDEEEITLPEEHEGQVRTQILSTTVVRDWMEDTQERRMYRVGGLLLVFGFFLQLIAQYVTL